MALKTNHLLTAGLLIALLFCIRQCNRTQGLSVRNLNAMADSVQLYKNKLGTQTATVLTLQLTNKELRQTVLSKSNELKALTNAFTKVSNITQYKSVTKFDTITIVYKDTIPSLFNRKGSLKTDWYTLKYSSNQKGILVDSLSFPNATSVIIGAKRKWFLGRETLVTEVTHTNPYIETQQITSAVVPATAGIYRKWYVWLGIGLAGGFLISK